VRSAADNEQVLIRLRSVRTMSALLSSSTSTVLSRPAAPASTSGVFCVSSRRAVISLPKRWKEMVTTPLRTSGLELHPHHEQVLKNVRLAGLRSEVHGVTAVLAQLVDVRSRLRTQRYVRPQLTPTAWRTQGKNVPGATLAQ
jgi:hypothetical protein